ncbi:MAG: DUF3108 domain-containing protein [Bacteroidales bacterium]|nr:DUF3108 domain-containing protein [Bacteroidales bacterium]
MTKFSKLCTLLLAFGLAAFPLNAAQPFFCSSQGRVLNYVRRGPDGGKVRWKYSVTFDRISKGPSGSAVEYTYDFRKPGGAQMYGGPIALHAQIAENGDVTLDLAATMLSIFRNMFPRSSFSSEGGRTVLPADLAPGHTLPDASAEVRVGALRYNVVVTERKVLREERLTTPAGEFDCVVVSEHKVESGMRSREVRTLTWYARGVGEVRHDTMDKNGKLQTSEVLESIE